MYTTVYSNMANSVKKNIINNTCDLDFQLYNPLILNNKVILNSNIMILKQ